MRRITKEQPLRSTSPRSSDAQRLRVTVKLPEAVIERARNAVSATVGLTLAALVERSLTTWIDELEKQRGTAFPARKKPLRVGRPRRTV